MKQVMKEQWEKIAAENAFYGVLSRDEFENPDHVDIDKFWETGRKDVEAFLKIVNLENARNLSMLEIGCGLGRMTHGFAERFNKVYALDVSSEMLSKAQSHWGQLPNVEWVLGNGQDLHQIPDKAIDFVFSFWVLQHIPQPGIVINYISEAERVLKDGGTAFLQFRVLPQDAPVVALKYYITTHWPAPAQRVLRQVWDVVHGYRGTRAKFARQYEAWRGCALKPSMIEQAAAELRLQIQDKDNLGRQTPGTQSVYYIFRKLEKAQQDA